MVIGASEKSERYSNKAIKALRKHGHPVVAIAPRSGKVEDVSFLTERENVENLDTVTLYVSAANQTDYYDYVVGLNPTRVIFNPGTENPEFEKRLMNLGIKAERACTLVLLSIGCY